MASGNDMEDDVFLAPNRRGGAHLDRVPRPMSDAHNQHVEQQIPPPMPMTTGGKHPLRRNWQIWYDPPPTKDGNAGKEWSSTCCKFGKPFGTIEDFWCLFNNLPSPTSLQVRVNLHVFTEGTIPAWEESANKNGGKWCMELQYNDNEIDRFWQYTVLALIGEVFHDSKEISGAAVGVRAKKTRLSVWTRTRDDKDAQMRIGRKLREILELRPNAKLVYQDFASMIKGIFPPHVMYEA